MRFLAWLLLLGAVDIRAQTHGLGAREPIGAFLNQRLPPRAPSAATGWSTEPAFPNLTFRDPTFLTFEPGSDRLYVGTLWGVIHQFVNDPAARSTNVFLDLRDRTQVSDNSGLLNMAFHPQFGQAGSPNRGYVYVFYQYSATPQYGYQTSYNRLSRFTVPDGSLVADRASELVLIDQFDPHVWHNGGGLFFGADGFLYLSVGAAGGSNDSYNVAQRLDSGLFSGVLRIDVDRDPSRSHPIRRQPQSIDPSQPSFSGNYYIPNDNPFLDPGGSILEEFWAIGLRSPHRMTRDPSTGRIWVGDVGQNTAEEINVIVRGGNYQWAFREGVSQGPKPRPGTVLGIEQSPVYSYPPGDGNNSVIGGYVYRGIQHAALLDGLYIFGDNGSGRIWGLSPGSSNPVYLCNLPPGGGLTGLSSFGVDRHGEIYMCKMGNPGGIFRLARTSTGEIAPPALLSQTGAFANVVTLAPAPGLIPYTVNSPLWSDAAAKHRWLAVPNDGAPYAAGEVIAFSPKGVWGFPAGTVFVKHFELPTDETNPAVTRRLETRLLVRDVDGGVYGLTYKWRTDGSDADLLPGSLNEDILIRTASGTRTQTWFYPSRQACISCHSGSEHQVLGLNTRQLNGNFTYPTTGVTDNQLRALNNVGMFSPALTESAIPGYDRLAAVDDLAASLEHRVRSYLDANCANCHNPGGGRGFFDARFNTPLAEQGIINGPLANSPGDILAHVVTPGSLDRSQMYSRMNTVDNVKMPPIARNTVDLAAVNTLAEWIASLTPSEPVPADWSSNDVGAVNYAGGVTYEGDRFSVRGSGSDIWGTADAFHFVHQPWSGDGQIVAQVTSVQNTDSWAKAGIMIRESLAANARNTFAFLTPANGLHVQHRATTGGPTTSVAGPWGVGVPYWVRLVRTGNTIVASASPDGSTWTTVATHTVSMGATVHAGLAVTSHNAGIVCTATFARVSVSTSGTSEPPPTDPVPPAAPTGLVASAASTSRIDLAWTDPSTNEDAFRIERATAGGSFAQIAVVGANVTAYADTGLAPATTYSYRVRAAYGLSNSAYSNSATATTLSGSTPPPASDWVGIDVGAVAAAGSHEQSGDSLTVRGSGADIWGSADEFRFVYRMLSGDGTIIARVASVTNTHGWAKAGLMMRESLTANARYSGIFVTPRHGVVAQARANTGGSTSSTSGPSRATAPYWVRLVRTGGTVVASASADGAAWTTVATHTVALGSTVYAGLAVTSHNDGVICTGSFQNVSLAASGAPPPPPPATPPNPPAGLTATAASSSQINLTWTDGSDNETGFELERSLNSTSFTRIATLGANATSHADTGLAAATAYYYRIRAVNSAGPSTYSNVATATTAAAASPPASDWVSQDIGAVGLAGSASESAGTVSLTGSGADIWGSADAFRFHHRQLTGDGEIVARVTSLTNTDGWAKAGVMFRESLAANSRHAWICQSIAHGAAFQYRELTGGQSGSSVATGGSFAPRWLRVVRSGNTFTGYHSTDGVAWTEAGTQTLALPATIYVGLAVTSHNNGALCTATFQNVAINTGLAPPPPPVTVNAPSGLTATVVSATQVNLAWTDNSTNETSFEVQRATGGTIFAPLASVGAGQTAFSDTTVTAGTTYAYRVRAVAGDSFSAFSNTASATPVSNPPPPTTPSWAFGDIGAVGVTGSNTSSGNTITIRGSGSDIWGTADAFRFVYLAHTGDGVVEARVASMEFTDGWAKAGVMIRESLSPNSRNAFAFVTPVYHGIAAQSRPETGGATNSVSGPVRNAPYWVRLTRSGSTFTAAASPDGVTWTVYATFTINMSSTVYFGFAVTSHDNTQLNTAVFEDPFVQ